MLLKMTNAAKLFLFLLFAGFLCCIGIAVNGFELPSLNKPVTVQKHRKQQVSASDFYKFYRTLKKHERVFPVSASITEFYIPYELRR